MQCVIINNRDPLGTVGVIHNNQELIFDTKSFKSKNVTFNILYGHLNGYIASLPKVKQDSIFDAYVKADEIFACIFNPDELTSALQEITKQIYENFNWSDVSNWVYFKSNIRYPTSLLDVLPIEDIGNDEKTVLTYLKHEYVDLIILSLALHFMLPIWGSFIARQQKESGSTYKEEDAFAILRSTWIASTPAMLRLRNYLQYLTNKAPDSVSATIHSLGTASVPDYLLSLSVIRRVVCSNIDSSDPTDNLVAKIYTFINSSVLRGVDRRFSGMVSDKKPNKKDDGDKTSTLEQYKIKQYFPDGDAVMINVFLNDPYQVASLIDRTVSMEKVKMCLDVLESVTDFDPYDHQLTLCKYVMAAVIPPKTVSNLNYDSLMRALAITQAVLWEWGFIDLAVMVTTKKAPSSEVLFGDIEKRFNPQLVDRLVELYPFYSIVQRASADKPEQVAKKNNPALRAIDLFVGAIVNSQWISHAPAQLTSLTENYLRYDKSHRTPQRIRDNTAELIIHLAERKKENVPGLCDVSYEEFAERFRTRLPEIWDETHRNMDTRNTKSLHDKLMDSVINFIKANS